MDNASQLTILQKGVTAWNEWRKQAPLTRVDLSGAKLSHAFLQKVNLENAKLTGASFLEADLREANLRGATLYDAYLHKANLQKADLSRADFTRAHLSGANLNEANLYGSTLLMAHLNSANLTGASLIGANLNAAQFTSANLSTARLWWANLASTNFSGADLRGAELTGAALVRTDFSNADLTGCYVFGASTWKVVLNENTKQQDLIITETGEPLITVDNIEVAQFVYLLLHNEKIRSVIDTITSKMVLVLGRFTPDRKVILDALRNALRVRNLLPVIFDFLIPANRDVTETIRVLAGLARFVIADITDATEVRVELHNIVRDFNSLPVQPILLRGQPEFVSLSHLKKFPALLPTLEYDDQKHLLTMLDVGVLSPAEAKVMELRHSGR